jgi:membrane protein required for colicin V production
MIWIDYSFLVVIVVSALFGLSRGLVREALSLVTWVLAIWISIHFSPMLGQLMTGLIEQETMRTIAAFLVLFIGTLLTGSVITYLISSGLKKIGLGFLNRLGGLLFGLIRGCGIIMILIYVVGLTPLKRESWWHQSVLISPFEQLVEWMRSQAPPEVVKQIESNVKLKNLSGHRQDIVKKALAARFSNLSR